MIQISELLVLFVLFSITFQCVRFSKDLLSRPYPFLVHGKIGTYGSANFFVLDIFLE